MVAILVHIFFFTYIPNGCTRRECWCTPLPYGAPRPMSLVVFMCLFPLCPAPDGQPIPVHIIDRLQIPSGRLNFVKGYSTL